MIGQKKVLRYINNLIKKGFPRFTVITGTKGQGKTELAIEISKKLKIPFCNIGTKVDDIRDMIELAYKQTEPIIYLIQDADKMSLGAKNSLLKIIEEPPQQAYFIMELQQIENTLDTIKSRCQEIKLDSYDLNDIEKFIEKEKPDLDDENKKIIKCLAKNCFEVKELIKYNPTEFKNYIDKVFANIDKVQSANSFKIADKLDLKEDGNRYNVKLFLESLAGVYLANYYIKMNEHTQEGYTICFKYLKCIDIIYKYVGKLKVNGINVGSIVDMVILDIRKELR